MVIGAALPSDKVRDSYFWIYYTRVIAVQLGEIPSSFYFYRRSKTGKVGQSIGSPSRNSS